MTTLSQKASAQGLPKNRSDLPHTENDLRKGIHPWMANLIALGGIIGSAYFIGSGWLVKELGVSAAFAFMIGGLVIYVVMRSFAELLVNIPRRGSFVSYSREFIHPIWAVATGWSYWFNWVAYVPSEAVAGSIIMVSLFGEIPMLGAMTGPVWAFVFLTLITIINLTHVERFGFIESMLAILKITAVIVFSAVACLIVFGLLGGEPVGTTILFPSGSSNWGELFPSGFYPLLGYLAIILVNFQGSEIIGLAASETQNPEETVPRACRQVTWRIIGIFVIPITFLVLILARTDSGLDDSMFAAALDTYAKSLGLPWLHWIAAAFAVVVLTAAFSCANAGMFGTVRSMYALSVEGMAPKFFARLNKNGVPQNATIFTLLCCWVTLIINIKYGESDAYAILLSVSGFTGAICWISICLSQVMFRRKVMSRGYAVSDIKSATPLSPWLPLAVGVGLQGLGLMLMLGDPRTLLSGGFAGYMGSGDPVLQKAFFASIVALVLPMVVFWIAQMMGKVKLTSTLHGKEKAFDELFPDRSPDVVLVVEKGKEALTPGTVPVVDK